ncbi:MAG TPA: hypothetical protein PLI79_02965 [Mycobacterium sp.]|nr:hypothetical protein [Mycobacterium sp.]
MTPQIEPSTTNWQQHLGDGEFVWVRSFIGTQRVAADGYFKVTILENQGTDGQIERRLMMETEQDYSPDQVDEWVVDVVSPETALERATLIIEACNEIEQRATQEGRYTASGFPSAGGSDWGMAHLDAMGEDADEPHDPE